MFLRQSTSQVVRFGPFLDSTDGVTAETALTIAQADMQLSKDGAAFAQKNAAGNATHDADGWYSTTLNTTDTDTVGELYMQVAVSGALPVWVRYWVVEEQVYDRIYGASALGPMIASEVNTEIDTALADIHLDHLLAVDYDPAAKPGVATALLNEIVESNAGVSRFTAGALAQAPDTDHVGTGTGLTAIPWNASWDAEVQSEVDDALVARSLHFLVDTALPTNWTTDVTANSALDYMADDGTATFDRTTDSLQAIADSGGGGPTAAQIADAVWDESTVGHTTAGTFGEQCATDIDAILADTADMQPKLGTPAGASISADIATVDTVVDGIQTDLDNGTDGLGAIKADTAAILADTGTDGVVIAAAQTVATVTDVTNRVTANVDQIAGDATAATNLSASALGIETGAAIAGTLSTTQMTTNLAEATDDHFIGRVIVWTSGVLANQASDVTDYDGTSKMLTYTATTEAPSAADTFVIV